MTIQERQNQLKVELRKCLDKFTRETGLLVPYMEVRYQDISTLSGKSYMIEKINIAVTTEPPPEDQDG